MEDIDLIKELSSPLYRSKGWIKLLGVLSIAWGVVSIFSVVGILVCWLPIWIGILLWKASRSIELAMIDGDKDQLLVSMSKLKTYFTIQGILVLIGLIIFLFILLSQGNENFLLRSLGDFT